MNNEDAYMATSQLLQTYLRQNQPQDESVSLRDMTPVLILGLLKKLQLAHGAFVAGDAMSTGFHLGRATSILDALRDDLDLVNGGTTARDYENLYGLIDECLQKAIHADTVHWLNLAEESVLKVSDWWTFSGEGCWGQVGHA